MKETQETKFRFLGWEKPLKKEMTTHSSILVLEIHGQRNLVGYTPWGLKELDTTEHSTCKFIKHYFFNACT